MNIEYFKFSKKIVDQYETVSATIQSESMHPLLKVGDHIKIQRLDAMQKLRRFDLIVFNRNDTLICHFVWLLFEFGGKSYLVTRSLRDHMKSEAPLTEEQILGVVPGIRIGFCKKAAIILKNLCCRSA